MVCINTLTVIHTFVQTAVVIEYFYCLYTYIKYVYICVHGQGINVYFIIQNVFSILHTSVHYLLYFHSHLLPLK